MEEKKKTNRMFRGAGANVQEKKRFDRGRIRQRKKIDHHAREEKTTENKDKKYVKGRDPRLTCNSHLSIVRLVVLNMDLCTGDGFSV